MLAYTIAAYLVVILGVIFTWVCFFVLITCDKVLVKVVSAYLMLADFLDYIGRIHGDISGPSVDSISDFLYKLVHGMSLAGDPCVLYLKGYFGASAVFFIMILIALAIRD